MVGIHKDKLIINDKYIIFLLCVSSSWIGTVRAAMGKLIVNTSKLINVVRGELELVGLSVIISTKIFNALT